MMYSKHVHVTRDILSPERLDTGFYSYNYFKTYEIYSQSNFNIVTIGSISEPWCFGAYALTNQIEWTDTEGIPFLKVESLGSPLLEISKISYVTLKTHNLLVKSQVSDGDIIVSAAGSIGKVAIIPKGMSCANSNQATLKFNPNTDSIDNYFISVQLCSKYGSILLNREAGGSVQQNLYLFNFKRIPLFLPNLQAQKYIGNKVRQAESLRSYSKKLISQVSSFHQNIIPKHDISSKRWAWTEVDERMDAEFYPGNVVEYFSQIAEEQKVSLKDISLKICSGTTQKECLGSETFQITVANLSANFLSKSSFECFDKNEKRIQNHDLLICAAAHNASYIGKDITYAITDNQEMIPSTEVLLVRMNRDMVPSSYVREYLLSDIGFTEIQSCIRGITAHLYSNDLGKILIALPQLTAEEQEDWFAQDLKMELAARLTYEAERLTTAAKYLVEALIEQKVTEEVLIEAQEALEDGDNSKDRAILARLTVDGFDIQGADPLFPDLDRLYELIEQAKEPEEEDSSSEESSENLGEQ